MSNSVFPFINDPKFILARIRCAQECLKAFKNVQSFPESLCYSPSYVEYKTNKSCKISLYSHYTKESTLVKEISCNTDSILSTSGEDVYTSSGHWVVLTSVITKTETIEYTEKVWLQLCEITEENNIQSAFIKSPPRLYNEKTKCEKLFGRSPTAIFRWDEIIDYHYSIEKNNCHILSPNCALVESMKTPPLNWSLEHDEILAQFLAQHFQPFQTSVESPKNFINSIEVSSNCDDEYFDNILSDDTDLYWESDGSQGRHWIRFHIKKGVIIEDFSIIIDESDGSYTPTHILVYGGEMPNLQKLNDLNIDPPLNSEIFDFCVLQRQKEYLPVVEIRIKNCKDNGIDAKIHGVKIRPSKNFNFGLDIDIFSKLNLEKYPKLESFETDVLYNRANLLNRFILLFDSVISYIVPTWEFSVKPAFNFQHIRQLLIISAKRQKLIETFLKDTEICPPSDVPKIHINRRIASEHKSNPMADPSYKNSIFQQMFEELKPKESYQFNLDYRWPPRFSQWWECKFLSEGIIDQGGGFRDSLADIADELCPTDFLSLVPLPFFIRSPNNTSADSNINKDAYVPNPGCEEFNKYEWIGKLMGACFRSKESLILTFPRFLWKKINCEPVSWLKDYITVDETQVRIIENMRLMNEEEFDAYFGGERFWRTTLSDGSPVQLKSDKTGSEVQYIEREEFGRLVIEKRMLEFDKQIEALRRGLVSVISQPVLDLITWQELEKKICGDPEISIDALKASTHYEDELTKTSPRVVLFWEVLTSFSNEDRSRFLRFVTGRRRLPTPICLSRSKDDSIKDSLPESSTCSNTLYLPEYTSSMIAEKKLLYAAYNCIAIDTDMSPWEE